MKKSTSHPPLYLSTVTRTKHAAYSCMYILYALSLKHKRQTKHTSAAMARRSVLGAQPAG
eukprot:6123585-Prymnesium_polylepis.1